VSISLRWSTERAVPSPTTTLPDFGYSDACRQLCIAEWSDRVRVAASTISSHHPR